MLVEIGHLLACTTSNHAAVRLQFTQQHLDQRRLAGAIRPDDADAVTAQDGCGEIPDDDLLAELQADVLGLEHQPA